MGAVTPVDGYTTATKHLIAARAAYYPANDVGLVGMAGNVAELSSTTWTPAGLKLINDVNPELSYQADYKDSIDRTLKVIKGGSWKDIARYIRANNRTKAPQNVAHSYIGFRCVRSAIEFSK